VLAGAVVLLVVAFLFGVFGWIVTTSYSLMRAVEVEVSHPADARYVRAPGRAARDRS
jgi:hypothetical protein